MVKKSFRLKSNVWEQRKLGDVAPITMGQSPDGENYTANSDDHILVQGNADMKDHRVCPRVWTTQITKTAKPGDIILSVRAPVGEVGKTEYNVVLGRGVSGISGNDFIYQSLIRMNQAGYWSKLSTGSTFDSINSDDIFGAILLIPSEREQSEIGSFLLEMDHAIVLHQRKLDKLKLLKKSLLQKMFPKNGSDKPLVRFVGFTDSWEQRKLSDCLSFLKDGTHGSFLDSQEGPYLLSAKNIKNGEVKIDPDSDRKISWNDFRLIHANFRLLSGDVLLTIVGSIGESCILKKPDGITFQRSVAFLRPGPNVDSLFLRTITETKAFQSELNGRKNSSAQAGVYLGELSIIPTQIPALREQKELGGFFDKLDSLIVLHQRELDKLKLLKKSLLQKMFI